MILNITHFAVYLECSYMATYKYDHISHLSYNSCCINSVEISVTYAQYIPNTSNLIVTINQDIPHDVYIFWHWDPYFVDRHFLIAYTTLILKCTSFETLTMFDCLLLILNIQPKEFIGISEDHKLSEVDVST